MFCSNLSERLSGRQTNNHAEIYVSKQEKYFHVYIPAIVAYIANFCYVELCSVHAKRTYLSINQSINRKIFNMAKIVIDITKSSYVR